MKHVISVGGGVASTLLLPIHALWVQQIPKSDVDLVMAKLPNEDPDVWRLVETLEDRLGVEVKMLGSNRHPWEVFVERKFIGNTLVDPCSDELKRKVIRRYIKDTYAPGEATIHVGIGAYELDRELSIKKRWGEQGYEVAMPLIEYPALDRTAQIDFCRSFAGFVPRLYLMGFSHNNCGGACVKAGQKEWARLLWFLPDVYSWWEKNENDWRSQFGDYTILRDRRGGTMKPMTLTDFRIRMQETWASTPPKYSNLVPGFQALEEAGTLNDLDPTPACSFCDAAA